MQRPTKRRTPALFCRRTTKGPLWPSAAAVISATGAVTPQQAIDRAVGEFARRGINCIVYRDGRRVDAAAYAEMAIRTAATRSRIQGEAQRRRAQGIDTVLVSQYGACSPTCLPWQGRVYIDDVWGEFTGETYGAVGRSADGNFYPLLSVAVGQGLFHPNCRHTATTYRRGVTRIPPPMDAAKVSRASALERRQRAGEREIRRLKRLEASCLDPDTRRKYKAQLRAAQQEQRELVAEHGDILRRDYWREKGRLDGGESAAMLGPIYTGQEVRFNDSASYTVKIEQYSEDTNRIISMACKEVAQRGSEDRKEHLCLVNMDKGKIEYRETGGDDSVGGPSFWEHIKKRKDQRFIFVHNHNTDGWVSEQDMQTLLSTENIAVMVAVRNDGIIYVVVKGKLPRLTKHLDMVYYEDINQLRRRIQDDPRKRFSEERERLVVYKSIEDFAGAYYEFDTRTEK